MKNFNLVKDIISINLHSMNYSDAKYYLERLLVNADNNIKEIEVIHGYRNGDALMQLVRNNLKSKRIKRRVISMNPGVTNLLLWEKKEVVYEKQ